MKIVYLDGARADIVWMRRYYTRVFPEGYKRARRHFKATESLLAQNPRAGHKTEFVEVFELAIARTPFSLIYFVTHDQIEVLRVWDARADRAFMDIK